MESLSTIVRKYGIYYVLILLHLMGGAVASFAIITSSIYAFVYFCFRKEVDIYVLFLLLFTSICIAPIANSEDNLGATNLTLYSRLSNVLMLGPIALSANLMLALAVPTRIVLNFSKVKSKVTCLIWIMTVLLALIGLLWSYSSGVEYKSGLTVGFRIALSLGVLFLPSIISTRENILLQIDRIFLTSVTFMAVGFMNSHWLFITYGFLPYVWIRYKSIIVKIIVLLCLSRALLGIESTITIIATLFLAIIFSGLIRLRLLTTSSFRHLTIFFALLPILLTVYILVLPVDKIGYDFDSILGYVKFKIIGDRKPIWDASFDQILANNFFLAPAGSSLNVFFDYISQWREWSTGSHNIFLEIGRQVNTFAMFFFSYAIVKALTSLGKMLKSNRESYILAAIISIYMAFGLSGQHIVYDGIGFLFWLLVRQLTLVNRSYIESSPSLSS